MLISFVPLKLEGPMMDATRFQQFMKDQIEEIQTVKEKADKEAGHNLGDDFVHDWINEESEVFREKWKTDHS